VWEGWKTEVSLHGSPLPFPQYGVCSLAEDQITGALLNARMKGPGYNPAEPKLRF
jgi:hypothetical protein